jgi:S-DNA-T family DNA segregation ATPase FtsK/SpoIIIE
MLENRSLKSDLFALGLLGIVTFLSVSLLTYEPADPLGHVGAPLERLYTPDVLDYPLNENVTNACGWWGAVTADLLFNAIGIGAYYLVFSLAVLDALLLLRREIESPVVRFAGWLLSLVGLTAMSAILLPGLSPGPVIGAGGYLGIAGQGVLETHFALAGSLILSLSVIVGGLMLCTDYAILRMLSASVRVASPVVRRSATLLPRVNRSPASAGASDTDPALKEDQKGQMAESDLDADELEVRVRGQSQASLEEEQWDKEDEEAHAEDEDFEEEVEEEDEDEVEEADGEEVESENEPEVKFKTPNKPRGGLRKPHFQARKQFDKRDRDAVMSELDEASSEDPGEYELPGVDLLIQGDDLCFDEQVKEVRRKAKILERTFANFGFTVKVVEIETGPVIAQYEVELEAGLRLSKITGLADDLAIALRVPSVRIVAPIPGKNTVGIEVPNEARQVVRLREVLEETNGRTRKMKIPLFLGKDVSGNSLSVDLASLPHLLIAGRTGTGKSVCLNAIISSILMTKKPDEVRMLLIDPKMVELSGYGRLPHLMHPVVTDMRKAEAILAWAVEKMEERYALLAKAGVRHITSYNQLGEEELVRRLQPENDEQRAAIPLNLPFIVIVADEIADLMMTAGKDVEQHIIRLAQKSRAVGIHLILATQKPTVDVITGLIKSNLPARISFQVASRTDSRVVLDEMGAEKLLGNGDMLFLWPGTSTLLRGQGTYLTDEEIERIVDCVSTGEQHFVNELVNLKVEDAEESTPGKLKKRDELYESAVDVVVREGRGSVSLLQRSLGIGYGRAARLIDFMAEDGIVGEYAGSQAREVMISIADWERMQAGDEAGETAPAGGPSAAIPSAAGSTKRRRSNKILPEPEAEVAAIDGVDLAGEQDDETWQEDDCPWDEDSPESDTQSAYEDEEYEDEEYEEGEYDEEGYAEGEYDEEEYEEEDYEEGEYEEEDAEDASEGGESADGDDDQQLDYDEQDYDEQERGYEAEIA